MGAQAVKPARKTEMAYKLDHNACLSYLLCHVMVRTWPHSCTYTGTRRGSLSPVAEIAAASLTA